MTTRSIWVSIAATAAGVGISALVVNYSQSAYKTRIEELKSLTAKLKKHLDRLEELKGQVPQFWDDAQGRETAQILNDECNKVREYIDWTEDMTRDFESVVTEMGSGLTTINDTIKSIGSAISALKG